MIKMLEYICNLNNNEQLRQLYYDITTYESDHFIPAVRYDTALLLNWMTNLIKPEKILEIGFGSGTSSIFIVHGNSIAKLISLERDKNRFIRGMKLLKNFEIKNIELLNIDSFDFFKTNENIFDFIFLDSVKREYVDYIEPLKKILKPGGLLICDNILYNGKVIDENIPDKYMEGVKLLKEFNNRISTDDEFNSFFLSIDDGISLSIKK